MRVTHFVIFSLSCLMAVQAHPAARPELVDEVEIVPLEDQFGRQPIVDTGVIEGGFFNPFEGFVDSFAGMMSTLMRQMDSLLSRLPQRNGTHHNSGPFGGFPGIPSPVDLDKGNTTSVTKIIDGHKVVINETEFKQDDDFGGTFFKVRIIDVQPDSSELTTEKNAEEVTTEVTVSGKQPDPESVETSFENEIHKNSESEDFSNLETFDEADGGGSVPEWERVEKLEDVSSNAIDSPSVYTNRLIDDTRVNQFLADAGAPTNPDAEVFEVVAPQVDQEWETLEK